MYEVEVSALILAALTLVGWYRRYTSRNARRQWAPYHYWIRHHKGDENSLLKS